VAEWAVVAWAAVTPSATEAVTAVVAAAATSKVRSFIPFMIQLPARRLGGAGVQVLAVRLNRMVVRVNASTMMPANSLSVSHRCWPAGWPDSSACRVSMASVIG
jgi:hypothetical protein